jgi:hypothetical protein
MMTITADDIYPQIRAALGTFEKMSAKERETQVTKYYAERFNELLSLGKQAMPNVVVSRWPKSIVIRNTTSNMGGNGEATYADIRAVLAELSAIVAEGVTPLEFGTI